ncbi:MAG: amidohydrolase family protein [Opitutaceae bacterium]
MAKSSQHPTPAPGEMGWLPECVYTGGKFETALAFFADERGRITRFSREPEDLAAARPLKGQAALPGLVNTHSRSPLRLARGRFRQRAHVSPDAGAPARQALQRIAAAMQPEDIYDAARMAFLEMMLSGVTCVGEFHFLHHQTDGSRWPEPNLASHEVLRAARDTGIRIALLKVAAARHGNPDTEDPLISRALTPDAAEFIRDMEALRAHVMREHPGDEAWLGIGIRGLQHAPIAYIKEVAAYAHAQRFRLHMPVSATTAENASCAEETGQSPTQFLASHGLIDKRFNAVHATHIAAADAELLGAARAIICHCPFAGLGEGASSAPPLATLTAAGGAFALGTDTLMRGNLLEEARLLRHRLQAGDGGETPDAASLLRAATVTGARSLGAPTGALEAGRPADFFTVNLHEPSVAGADADTLLEHIVFSLERRAIREIWVGGRRRIAGGHHPQQGAIIGRFVDLQRRLWGSV